jgi:hypothetical protein
LHLFIAKDLPSDILATADHVVASVAKAIGYFSDEVLTVLSPPLRGGDEGEGEMKE